MEATVGGEFQKPTSSEKKEELGLEKRRDRSSSVEAVTSSSESSTECVSGRERLKRHHGEVAGRVWIPEMWGQEDFLKDWVDSSVFDAAVRNAGLMSARAALMEEGRRVAASGFRIQNSC